MTLHLLAQIAGRMVAVASDQVESVVDIADVTPVARAPAAVRGLAALRSRVVTVIDPRIAIGIPADSQARRAVIVHVEGHHYAFLVDALEDVAPFDVQPLASGLSLDSNWATVARGVIERDGEPILAIDLAALVPTLAAAA
jgi:purine-binding chemotaxis protein CheW